MNAIAALRLARFDKPVGISLLWAPTAWALWIANQGNPPIRLLLYFLLGTVLMRAAGCVLNDMADRPFDAHVRRTSARPLVSGQIQLHDALMLLILLLLMAFLILLQLPQACFYLAIFALIVVAVYPFGKRFVRCPQLILGLAFSLGIPMAYAASYRNPDASMGYLLLINCAWVLAYDTEYAMVDRADDRRIGVKSSAIWFGSWDRRVIGILQLFCHGLWLFLAYQLACNGYFYVCWGIAALILVQQQRYLATAEENSYFKAFSSNNAYGLLLWLGLMLGMSQ
jgi:4-hydroxybenzoate polyprenyltransferase